MTASVKNSGSRNRVTVEEANRMLPLVQAIASDLNELGRDVAERRERLSVIMSRRDIASDDPYSEELAEVERHLQEDSRRLEGFVDELQLLGLGFDGADGSVFFPSMKDGVSINLSWRLGEPHVGFWFPAGSNASQRLPISESILVGDEEPEPNWQA